MIPPETLELLNQQDWARIFPALVRYADARISRLRWKTKDGKPRAGHDAMDVAKDAIERVYTGRRRWDPNAQTDILLYLCSVVNSLVNHSVSTPGHVRQVSMTPVDDDESSHEIEPPDTVTPHEHLLRKDLLDYLMAEAKGDDLLEGVVICLDDGEDKPAEMAKILCVDVDAIYKAQKRLRRIAERYNNELTN